MQAWACNSRNHHSVLSHYNHAQVVFIGEVLRKGKVSTAEFAFEDKLTDIKSYKLEFKITKTFKNVTTTTDTIIVGKVPGRYVDFEIGQQYLVYANPDINYDFLLCENGVAVQDSVEMQKHAFLYELSPQHSGYVVERSPFGRVWAQGQLQEGVPVGDWQFYALSGELQIKGSYCAGEECGAWTYYQHTSDATYQIYNKIYTGAYYELTGDYKLIELDTNRSGIFKNRLVYQVGTDKVVDDFYYNQPRLQKEVTFDQGIRDGIETIYNEKGDTLSVYTFRKGRLHGDFFSRQPLPSQENMHLIVRGRYQADKKMEEKHYYYEKNKLYQTKVVLEGGRLKEEDY